MGLPLDKLRFHDKFEAKSESALGFEAGAEGKIILEEKIEAEKNRKVFFKKFPLFKRFHN
jgi:hypothetical protein